MSCRHSAFASTASASSRDPVKPADDAAADKAPEAQTDAQANPAEGAALTAEQLPDQQPLIAPDAMLAASETTGTASVAAPSPPPEVKWG